MTHDPKTTKTIHELLDAYAEEVRSNALSMGGSSASGTREQDLAREAVDAAVSRDGWESYMLGLLRAGNMKTRIARGDEGSNVVNDLRSQIDAEVARVRAALDANEAP